jgi:hypothetical protein
MVEYKGPLGSSDPYPGHSPSLFFAESTQAYVPSTEDIFITNSKGDQ